MLQEGEDFGQALPAGEFNGDDTTDLVIQSSGSSFGSGTWEVDSTEAGFSAPRVLAAPLPHPDGYGSVGRLVAGDFNRDGQADLVQLGTRGGGQGYSALHTGGAGGLALKRELAGGPVGAAGDLNKDGYADLVTAVPAPPGRPSTGGRVEVWKGGSGVGWYRGCRCPPADRLPPPGGSPPSTSAGARPSGGRGVCRHRRAPG